jgi:hypothetical protein
MTEKKPKPERKPTHSVDLVRDVSEAIYRIHLNKLSGGGSGAVERMIAKDKDQGQKLRGRAAIYDPIIRTALEVLKIDTDFKL